jgi:hemoglobin-like flavoprotein
MMTELEIKSIRKSFLLLEGHANVFAAAFYKKLFQLNPNLRILFHSEMGDQSKKLMQTLILINTSLEHFHSMRYSLRGLGKRHAGYGVRPEHYAMVSSVLIQTMEEFAGSHFDATLKKAWTKLLALVSGEMLYGMNQTGILPAAPTAELESVL